jgi:hypothetical protein
MESRPTLRFLLAREFKNRVAQQVSKLDVRRNRQVDGHEEGETNEGLTA